MSTRKKPIGLAATSRGTCKCERPRWRIKVSLLLDIDDSLFHQLDKRTIRTQQVVIDGADWERAMAYCAECGVMYRGLGGAHP